MQQYGIYMSQQFYEDRMLENNHTQFYTLAKVIVILYGAFTISDTHYVKCWNRTAPTRVVYRDDTWAQIISGCGPTKVQESVLKTGFHEILLLRLDTLVLVASNPYNFGVDNS